MSKARRADNARRKWSAGRRSPLRQWGRAPPKRRALVTGLSRRRAAGFAKPAKGRLAPPPWRLPALHSLMRGTEKGKPACPAPSKNRDGGALPSLIPPLKGEGRRAKRAGVGFLESAPTRRSQVLAAALPRKRGDKKKLHPPAAIARAIGDAGFFQVQFVLDAPSRFVGDLAVAQQPVDEIALSFDQLGLDLGGLPHVIEALGQVGGQYLQSALIAGSQVLDRVVRQVVLF